MFTLDGRGLGFSGPIGIYGFLIFILIGLAIYFFLKRRNWESNEVELNVFGQKVKIKANHDVARISHKAWTELSSRKAAIEFDEEYDVITEVYDSWYSLFAEIRALIKDIPAEKIRQDPEVKRLVKLMMDTLNRGLRPHLTKWQASFRRWMELEIKRLDDNKNEVYLTPQEIQRNFPRYAELVDDLRSVNKFLISYAGALEEIAHGSSQQSSTKVIKEPKV